MLNLRDQKARLSLKLVVVLLFSLFILISCTATVPSPEVKESYHKWKEVLENQTSSQPKVKEEKVELKPKFIPASPLQNRINVAFYQEYYENILSFLSMEAGLSFVIDPEVKKIIPEHKSRLTFQFKNQPLEEVIKKVCEVLDIYPKIERGILYILPYEERIFNLGFLPVVKESRANLGGDVLGNIGAAGGGLTSPLKGEFSVASELSRSYLEVYTNLEKTVQGMLSDLGVYQLNLSAGILYVKDRPSNVRAIESFIKKFSEKYKRQIILDAQIVEIELNNEHNLGIDWVRITDYLMGKNRIDFNTLNLNIGPRTDQPTVSLTISGQPNVDLLLNFLKQYGEIKVLQNPKLRVLHSQPAIISVGTTFSYIKEIKRDVATGGGGTPGQTVTYTAQTSSIFDGILLGIVPYLAENGDIYLHIVPIKSELVEFKDVKFGLDYSINLPTVNLREMSSIVKARPGDLIVIGGLILDKHKNSEKRVAIPILDNIFRSQTGGRKLSELVIVIRLNVD